MEPTLQLDTCFRQGTCSSDLLMTSVRELCKMLCVASLDWYASPVQTIHALESSSPAQAGQANQENRDFN